MKIVHKLALNTVGIVLLVTSVTFIGIGFIRFNVNEIVERENPKIQAALEMEINAKETAASVMDYLSYEGLEEEKEQFWYDVAHFQKFRDQYAKHMRAGVEEGLLLQIDSLFAEFKIIADELFELKDKQDKLIDERGVILNDKVDVILDDKLGRLAHGIYEKDIMVREMEINVHELISATRGYLITGKSFLKDRITDSEQDYIEAEKTYVGLELNAEEQNGFNELKGYWKTIVAQTSEIVRLEDKKRELSKALGENARKMDNILDEQIQTVAMSKIAADETRTLAVISTVWATIVVICFLVIIVSVYISRSISAPIQDLIIATTKIGSGDLDTYIEIKSKDEIGHLAESFNQMTKDLKITTASRDEVNAANLQLQIKKQHLSSSNQKLQAEITGHKLAEEKLIMANCKAEDMNDLLVKTTAHANEMAAHAEMANMAKSEFLANMSHEIRTPMNAIIGFSDLLAEENLTADQQQDVGLIREAGNNLLKLINDILDFSKIEAGQLNIEIIDCSLGKILNSIESMMKPMVEKKSLEFKINESNGLPAQIRTDPARLNQCLLNLTNNAVKFTEQGYVHINVALVDKDDQPYIRFDVADTGIGIAKDRQQAIFESFTQEDGSTTRKYGGTGLGLTITKQLTGLLGGEISAKSEIGIGSVFSFVIPANVDITKQPFLDRHNIAGMLQQEYDKSKQAEFIGTCLVAEDVVANQMVIKRMLNKFGIEVDIANDGAEALRQAENKSFDLIFMDIQMPNMNGYEATEAIRKAGMTTPIVALTANAMKGDDKKCFEAGCDEYLPKPIDREKLLQILDKYLTVGSEKTLLS